MNRRRFLATAGLVALAGCSDGGDPSAAAVPPGEDNSSADDNQSDNSSSVEDAPEGPTDPEQAAEHIADAQAALQTVVDEIEGQAGLNVTFADLNASHTFDATPIDDALGTVRRSIDEARSFEMASDQEATVDALEDAESFVRAVINVQTRLHSLHTKTGYLLGSARAKDWEQAGTDYTDVNRTYNELNISPVSGAYMGAQGSMEPVDALTDEDVTAQRVRVDDEYSAIDGILQSVGILERAEKRYADGERLWKEYKSYEGGDELHTAQNRFSTAGDEFNQISNLTGGAGFSGGIDWLTCVGEHMEEASVNYHIACGRRINDSGDWQEMSERARAEAENANNCTLSM